MEPVSIYIACRKYLDDDFLSWSPEARKEVIERKSGKAMPLLAHNMLEAMVTLYVTNSPWRDSTIFEKIVWALNGHIPNMLSMETPPPYYVGYAVTIMKHLNKDEKFSEEVNKYIASVLLEYGQCLAGDPLQESQPFIDRFYENTDLQKEVETAWDKEQTNEKLELFTPDAEDPISAQLSKLVVNKLYLNRKEVLLKKELM